jgi:hypothetical protein
MISKKNFYSRVGFEPGSSYPEADAMSTVPRRQGINNSFPTFEINALGSLLQRCRYSYKFRSLFSKLSLDEGPRINVHSCLFLDMETPKFYLGKKFLTSA